MKKTARDVVGAQMIRIQVVGAAYMLEPSDLPSVFCSVTMHDLLFSPVCFLQTLRLQYPGTRLLPLKLT